MRFKLLLLVTTLLLYSTEIHAAPKIDANGDDEISRIEFMSYRSNAFNKLDQNFDSRITQQELKDATAKRIRDSLKSRFKKLDANGDGRLTQAEHDEAASSRSNKKTETKLNKGDKWFSRVDKDKNGHISRLEFDAYNETQATKAYKKSQVSSQKAFSRMDIDGDGSVTKFEFVDKGRVPESKTSNAPDAMSRLYVNEIAKPKKRL